MGEAFAVLMFIFSCLCLIALFILICSTVSVRYDAWAGKRRVQAEHEARLLKDRLAKEREQQRKWEEML